MLDFTNLPGVVGQINDYNLGTIQDDNSVSTESVLVLGTAVDGPVGIPVPLTSISSGLSLFGDFKDSTGTPNGATLMRGANETFISGSRDIRVMRISGSKAKASAAIAGTTDYSLSIEGLFEGDIYNNVSVEFDHTAGVVKITKPGSKMTDYEKGLNVGVGKTDSVVVSFLYADYSLTSESALVDLVKIINKQPNNNVAVFKIVDKNGNDVTSSLSSLIRTIKISAVDSKSAYALVGGDNGIGLDPMELYKVLGGYAFAFTADSTGTVSKTSVATTSIPGFENALYDVLSNYRVDSIILMDANADADLWPYKDASGAKRELTAADFGTVEAGKTKTIYVTDDNFARQLAQACALISAKSNECIGTIGTSAAVGSDLLSVKNHVNKLLGKANDGDTAKHVSAIYDLFIKNDAGQKVYGSNQKPVDIGGYISIVAAPDLAFADDILGVYAASGAASYAGLVTTLQPEFSTTNRKVSGTIGVRYELSGNQLNDLTGAGYVTFRTNFDGSVVVTDGVTAAGPLSDFQRLTTKRITNAAMNVVRKVCEPFIGLPNNLAQRNAITTAIQAGLDAMKAAGAIQDAQFDFYSSKKDQRLGNALIDLTIVPVFEFRKIRVYLNLKNPV